MRPVLSGATFGNLVRRPETGALIGTVGVFVFFAIFGGAKFLSAGGAASWLNVAAELGIIALPVGLLMIAGELDLSVGSVLAGELDDPRHRVRTLRAPDHRRDPRSRSASGSPSASSTGSSSPATKVPSFVVTLATIFGAGRPDARLVPGHHRQHQRRARAPDPPAKDAVRHARRRQVPGRHLLVDRRHRWSSAGSCTSARYGNWIFAVGGDNVSARATGIPADSVKIALFMGSGFGAAFVGVIQTILYNSAQVANGQSFIFNSIIAVVIGGVLLTGGYGSVVGIVLGTLTFAIVNQGIYYTGWNSDWASLIIGVLLLVAVLMNNTFRRMALSYAPRKKKACNVMTRRCSS